MNSEVAAMVAKGVRAKRAILKRIEKSDDYKDAAEFEARVAENLCNIDGRCLWSHCKDNMEGCTFCRLYYARIAAENEMD